MSKKKYTLKKDNVFTQNIINVPFYTKKNYIDFENTIESVNSNNFYDDFLKLHKKMEIINKNPKSKMINDIMIIIKKMKNDGIQFSDNNLTREENDQITKEITTNIDLIVDDLPLISNFEYYNVMIMYKYLKSLSFVLERQKNPSSCNIINIYIKYSSIIHILIMLYDIGLANTEESSLFEGRANNPTLKEIDVSNFFIFTRCYASANIASYLLSGQKSLNLKFANGKYEILNHIKKFRNQSNYYITLGVHPHEYDDDEEEYVLSDLNHIFLIIKQNVGNVDKYYVFQSYFYNKCPQVEEYDYDGIVQMINDIYHIYYDKNNARRHDTFTQMDNAVWYKYFHVSEDNFVDKRSSDDTLIKSIHDDSKFHIFQWNYNYVDTQHCYKYLIKILKVSGKKVKRIINILHKNIMTLFKNTKNIPIMNVIKAIKEKKYIFIYSPDDKTNDTEGIVEGDLLTENYPSSNRVIIWDVLKNTLDTLNPDIFANDLFELKNIGEFSAFLSILCYVYDLEEEIYNNMGVFGPNSEMDFSNIPCKYQCDYTRNRPKNYLK